MFFQKVRKAVDLLKLVADETGQDISADSDFCYCPFCVSANKSFRVNKERQIFLCYDCRSNGDVISFICRFRNISPRESVIYLAAKGGVNIPEEFLLDS